MINLLDNLSYHFSNISFNLLTLSDNGSIEELLKSDSSITPAGPPNYLFWFMRIFLALLVVIVFMVVFLYVLKKYLGKTNIPLFDKKKNIEVLSTTYLGPKKSICIVRIDSEILVLGITPNSINFLTKLEPKTESEKTNRKEPPEKSSVENKRVDIPASSAIGNGFKPFPTEKSSDNDFEEIFDKKISTTSEVITDEDILDEELDGEKSLLENIKKLRKISQNPPKI